MSGERIQRPGFCRGRSKQSRKRFPTHDLHGLYAGSLGQSENRKRVVGDRGLAWGRYRAMNMQTIASNIWLQFTLLAIAVVVLIVLAAQYIWWRASDIELRREVVVRPDVIHLVAMTEKSLSRLCQAIKDREATDAK